MKTVRWWRRDPYDKRSVLAPDPDGGGFYMHTPVVIRTDVWASREDDEDPSSRILEWVAEHGVNGYSLGFDYFTSQPSAQDIDKAQGVIMRALRDAIVAQYPDDDNAPTDIVGGRL